MNLDVRLTCEGLPHLGLVSRCLLGAGTVCGDDQTASRHANIETEVAQKGLKSSRASIIRSSANEILKEVRRGIVAETPVEPESTVSQMEDREQAEKIGTYAGKTNEIIF